ncbi:MAG: hypothetical protein ACOC54_06570 [Candidatus Sumerlaeota bacterium]
MILQTKEPISIYNNWGHYDELGDKVPLTEALVMEELDTLERWKKELDVSFDVFVLDCLWFEPTEGYRVFRRADWPQGPDRVFKRMRDLGMTPGLWFSTSGGRLDVPEWEASRCDDNWAYSLADGPYADALEDGFMFAADELGVRYFKLDFAGLQKAAKGVERSPQETMRLSVARLKKAIANVRAKYPDAHFITHCGYARKNQENIIGTAMDFEVDTGWLNALDAMFSGDPCCTDIPQTSLNRNVDLFQDREVWKLNQAGFPLHRIEDHGAVMGPTNTAMYRGRSGFRRTHLGQLARGGRRDLLYGDPTVLTDDDVRAMQAARTLFFDAFKSGLWTRFVGPGEPGVHPWHGYLTGGGDSGLLYLVNSSLSSLRVDFPMLNLMEGRVLFHDSTKPSIQVQPERLSVDLGPEQCALIGLGDYADAKWDIPAECDVPPPMQTRLLPLAFKAIPNGFEAALEEGLVQSGEELLVIAEAIDADPAGTLKALPFRFGKQATRESDDMTPQAHEMITIRCHDDKGEIKPLRQIPDVPVWSGISWVARIFSSPAFTKISVEQNFESSKRLRLTALALKRSE